MRLCVTDSGVAKLSIPAGAPAGIIRGFLEKNEDFLRRASGGAKQRSSIISEAVSGAKGIFILGIECKLEMSPVLSRFDTPRIDILDDGRAIVFTRKGRDFESETTMALRDLCLRAARCEAPKACLAIGSKEPASISTGKWAARWGACDSKGNVSVDWRCVLLPAELFSHIVAHECCHLLEMNHSSRFWSLVSIARPDWKRERHALKEARRLVP